MILLSNYVHGSDGNVNLYWDDEIKHFVIQWRGEPRFGSDYTAKRFDCLLEAVAYFHRRYGDAHLRNKS